MAGKEKASMGKRNKRPKENAESGKRMSILLLFWEMTELPLVNRWKGIRKFWWGETEPGRKAKQGRAQGETGPDADTGITGKDPLRRKAAKNAAESLFPLFGGNFPVLLNTELKTGILTGLRRSRGDYDIPLSKVTTEKRPAGIDRALFCWTEGIMKAITHSRFRYRFRRLR